jgi:hypothetical protein
MAFPPDLYCIVLLDFNWPSHFARELMTINRQNGCFVFYTMVVSPSMLSHRRFMLFGFLAIRLVFLKTYSEISTSLRGVSTNKTIICFIAMQTYKELINSRCFNNFESAYFSTCPMKSWWHERFCSFPCLVPAINLGNVLYDFYPNFYSWCNV